MFRVSIVKLSKFGSFLGVSKQSQQLFSFSSKNVISLPPNSHQLWTASDEGDLILLKAKQDVILAGMKERHELQIQYSQEKQEISLQFLEESYVVQLGKASKSNKQQCPTKSIEVGTDAVPMESPPVAIPKLLFKNDDEIKAFCDDIYRKQIKKFTPEIANKIVHVLTNCSGDTGRPYRVLNGVYDSNSFYDRNGLNAGNLSDAGFGKALSTLLFANSNNYECVDCINRLLAYDSVIGCENKYAQDLYDAIDSSTGYDGTIFDALLKIMRHQNERATIDVGFQLIYFLIKNTQFAKSIMIKKGFLNVLENFDSSWDGTILDMLRTVFKK